MGQRARQRAGRTMGGTNRRPAAALKEASVISESWEQDLKRKSSVDHGFISRQPVNLKLVAVGISAKRASHWTVHNDRVVGVVASPNSIANTSLDGRIILLPKDTESLGSACHPRISMKRVD